MLIRYSFRKAVPLNTLTTDHLHLAITLQTPNTHPRSVVTRIVLQLRRPAEENQTVNLGQIDISGEDETAIAGFRVADRRQMSLQPIRFAVPSLCQSVEMSVADPEDTNRSPQPTQG
jgi:hypothetical protein